MVAQVSACQNWPLCRTRAPMQSLLAVGKIWEFDQRITNVESSRNLETAVGLGRFQKALYVNAGDSLGFKWTTNSLDVMCGLFKTDVWKEVIVRPDRGHRDFGGPCNNWNTGRIKTFVVHIAFLSFLLDISTASRT